MKKRTFSASDRYAMLKQKRTKRLLEESASRASCSTTNGINTSDSSDDTEVRFSDIYIPFEPSSVDESSTPVVPDVVCGSEKHETGSSSPPLSPAKVSPYRALNDFALRDPESERKMTDEQEQAMEFILQGFNVVLLGSAGTGKTFTTQIICKQLKERGKKVAVTASTGTAAINHPSGKTLHSFTGIGLGNGNPGRVVRGIINDNPVAYSAIEKTDVLVIDEVSMIQPYTFSLVDFVCRSIRKRPQDSFGGIQLLLIGDFFQLPPVIRDAIPGEAKYVFQTKAWRDAGFRVVTLTQNQRQTDDPDFFRILEDLRFSTTAEARNRVCRFLRTRLRAKLELPDDIPEPVYIYARNKDVNQRNYEKLAEIDLPEHEFVWTERCDVSPNDRRGEKIQKAFDTLRKNVPVDETLKLKEGAQVILVRNVSVENRLVNGSQGVVEEFLSAGQVKKRFHSGDYREIETFPSLKITLLDTESDVSMPIVHFPSSDPPMTIPVPPMSWSNPVDDNTEVSIEQIPLRLGYACTVHRSMGMTLDYAYLGLSGCFAEGQVYVAVSRLRTSKGMSIIDFNERGIRVDPLVCDFYKNPYDNFVPLDATTADAWFEKRRRYREEAEWTAKQASLNSSLFSQQRK